MTGEEGHAGWHYQSVSLAAFMRCNKNQVHFGTSWTGFHLSCGPDCLLANTDWISCHSISMTGTIHSHCAFWLHASKTMIIFKIPQEAPRQEHFHQPAVGFCLNSTPACSVNIILALTTALISLVSIYTHSSAPRRFLLSLLSSELSVSVIRGFRQALLTWRQQ